MGAVLEQRRLELRQQVIGQVCGEAAALQALDQGILKNDMPLPLGDVIVHHLEVGRRIGHGAGIAWGGLAVA